MKVEADIKDFQSLLNKSLEVKNFFKDPTFSIEQQNKVINLISNKLSFSKNLENFFLLLIQKRRILFVNKISEMFLRLCSQKRGELKASLISSKELNTSLLKQINKELSDAVGSNLKFDKVDKELIGLKFQLVVF